MKYVESSALSAIIRVIDAESVAKTNTRVDGLLTQLTETLWHTAPFGGRREMRAIVRCIEALGTDGQSVGPNLLGCLRDAEANAWTRVDVVSVLVQQRPTMSVDLGGASR